MLLSDREKGGVTKRYREVSRRSHFGNKEDDSNFGSGTMMQHPRRKGPEGSCGLGKELKGL